MDSGEAVRLFADRAAASNPGFAVGPDNVAAVASICRALDGLPLAIELAASRVRVLSVEQIRDRLGDRFALLTAGDRSAPPRQRTLRAAIGWSHDMLTTAERTLFRRLSVFAGWLDTSAVSSRVRGAALVSRAQLTLASDPAGAETLAVGGLELCREAGGGFWTAVALNLLSETAVQTGQIREATARADQAMAQGAGDQWNEGYALGTRAAIAARTGKLREAGQLAGASVSVMRRIDQQWGAARVLLGLGDLARLRDHPGEAHERYVEALPILQEIGARSEIARCLAGLGRVAMDLGATGQARRHLTRSIRLSQATGTRISIARGLEAFAVLAVHEDRPEVAVQLIAAASALRERAGQLPLPGTRTETCLAPARRLGEPAVARLWAQGLAMDSETAVALALDTTPGTPEPGGGTRPSSS